MMKLKTVRVSVPPQRVDTFEGLGNLHLGFAMLGFTDPVIRILDEGSDINFQDSYGWTALMYAAWKNHILTVHALLDRGAEIEIKNYGGETAIDIANNEGHEEMSLLLEEGLKDQLR